MTKVKDPSAASFPTHGRPWVAGLLLLALGVLAYLPATQSAFIWDDDAHLTANPCIVGPLGLKDIWTSAHARICPLVLTTFWIEHRLWGLNPLPYHLVNILFHVASALVLWRVLLALGVRGAWLGAALWMLHPVQVESVAWITEMKNTQSGLFFLLAVLFFCKSREQTPRDTQKSRSRFHYALTLLFGALALASKSSTVVLPLVLGLCAWWLEGHWQWRRNLRELSPLLLLSLLAGVLSIWTQRIEGAGEGQEWALSAAQRLVVAGRALWFYLGKLLWPHPLVMIYPRWEVAAANALGWLPLIAAVLFSVVLWRYRNAWQGRGRALFFSWSYFVLALLPVLGLLNHGFLFYSFVGDRFQYLASMGPLALAGAGLHAGLNTLRKPHPLFGPTLGSLLLLTLGTLTWRQCAIYRNEEVLWTATLPRNPSCWVAYYNLGFTLMQQGRQDEAEAHIQRSLELNPDYAEAHNKLGILFQDRGRLDEALVQFQRMVEITPGSAEAQSNLGCVLMQKGRPNEALAHLQKAIGISPDHALAHNILGVLHLQNGRLDDALAHFSRLIEIDPGSAESHNSLGIVLLRKGRMDEALAQFGKAIEINPVHAKARENIGSVLLQKGLPDEALAHLQRAIEINPGSAETHNNLGNALLQKGQVDEAIAQYEKAIEMSPDYAFAHYNLSTVLMQKGQADEALTHLQRSIEINPGFGDAHRNLGVLLQDKGRLDEAAEHYQKAIEINGDDAQALNNLAFLLSAADKASLRDGKKALRLAEQASKLTGGGNPIILGAQAAAHAELGEFSEAVGTLDRAIQLAETQGHPDLAAQFREHLKLYKSQRPLRVAR